MQHHLSIFIDEASTQIIVFVHVHRADTPILLTDKIWYCSGKVCTYTLCPADNKLINEYVEKLLKPKDKQWVPVHGPVELEGTLRAGNKLMLANCLTDIVQIFPLLRRLLSLLLKLWLCPLIIQMVQEHSVIKRKHYIFDLCHGLCLQAYCCCFWCLIKSML